MKDFLHVVKRFFQNLIYATIIILVVYIFLGLCNWNTDIEKWTNLSKFVLVMANIIMAITTFEAMAVVVYNYRMKKENAENETIL